MQARPQPPRALPVLIAVAGVAAYAGSFSGPFVFDDVASIVNNPTLRHWGTALFPPLASTTGGRPFLNLSLAFNYAVSGTAVWSYHAVNLAIHVLAALTLFGILRRTLVSWGAEAAARFAFWAALLWILHPLQTEAVTYLVQRGESLMGLCYLLTLYGFIRGAAPGARRPRAWFALSFVACLLGMATKEVMVSAPLIVFLYDRTFLAGSFREAWRRRGRVYAGLAATWLLLPLLILSAHGRNGTAGFGGAVSWSDYALTQFPAIVHYLRLCLWPHPLIFFYGRALELDPLRVLPSAALILTLLAATGWALVRKPAGGFLGAVFFLILAPSSSIVPVATETVAEHRMYLPLIPVVVLVVLGLDRWLGKTVRFVFPVLAVGLFVLTWQRNETYGSALGLWNDTLARDPANPWVRNELGTELARTPGRTSEAVAQFQEAVRLKPDYIEAHGDLGNALLLLPGRANDAVAEYQEAVRLRPDFAAMHNSLGDALASVPGRLEEAIAEYREAIRLKPDYAVAHYDLGVALIRVHGRSREAQEQLEAFFQYWPDKVQARQILARIQASYP